MERKQPTESQIDVLMSDWLGNLRQSTEGNYTHKGEGGIRHKEDTTMREYLLGNVRTMDTLDLMKNARMAAEQIVNTVTPHQVKISFGGSGSYHTETEDGRQLINIASDYFDDTISPEEKVDILFGLATHEASHSAYTDNSLTESNIGKEHPELQQLKHNIWNIIEDERIEYHLGEDRPGLAGCIGATKGYYFKRLVNAMKSEGKMPTEPLPKLLAAITQAVRYPSEMTREQVIENFDELDAIRHALTPYPLSPEAAWEATDRIMDIIRKTAEEEIQKEEEEKQQGQQAEKQQNGTSKNQNQQNPAPSSSSGNANNDAQGSLFPSEEESPFGNTQPQQRQPSEQEILQKITQALSTSQGKKVMDAIKDDINKGNPVNSSSVIHDEKSESFVDNDDSERMCSGAGGGHPDTFVRKPKGNPQDYQDSLRNIRKYIPAMARALKCKSEETEYILKSQPRGKLDTNKLVSFRIGNENIFRKSGTITCSSASVCMLIDESGSMSGNEQQAAREAAILVNEAIKRIHNVNFYCYGYTTKQLAVYSENNRTSPWALSETDALDGTPTGRSMQLAAQRIRRYTNDPVLMLVLTDGHADNPAMVIQQDNNLRQKGFIPVGVGILTNAVEKTFKDHIVMLDISKFAQDMGKLTKGKLDKMLIRRDSNE